MAVSQILKGLDLLHPSAQRSEVSRRNVFGVQLPAYVSFHAIFGYILLAVGLAAILLRLPLKAIRKQRWLHLYLGYTWVFGTIWIAVTSIWCVRSFVGWDVIAFFIFSMYASIQLGFVLIKVYRRQGFKQEMSVDETSQTQAKIPVKLKVWKWLHAVAMIYSFCMLLGAGISFPFRAFDDYRNHKNG